MRKAIHSIQRSFTKSKGNYRWWTFFTMTGLLAVSVGGFQLCFRLMYDRDTLRDTFVLRGVDGLSGGFLSSISAADAFSMVRIPGSLAYKLY
ncbi:MAG: hypothetical protein U0905_18985 [Pirellulales bacterium]